MKGTELTPFFTFNVGVIGGLILGFCLCYLWMNWYYLEDESIEEDPKVPPVTTIEDLPEGVSPYMLDMGIVVESPKTDESTAFPVAQDLIQAEESPTLDPSRSSSAPEPVPVPLEFTPPGNTIIRDSYAIGMANTLRPGKNLPTREWKKALKNIHQQVRTTHILDNGLSDQVWLSLNLENSGTHGMTAQKPDGNEASSGTQPSPAKSTG